MTVMTRSARGLRIASPQRVALPATGGIRTVGRVTTTETLRPRSAPLSAERIGPAHRTSSRNTALDALRGLAALVVVAHHILLVSPAFESSTGYTGFFAPLWYSPARDLVDGNAAVWVFFVLSGVVVMLPVRRWTSRQWAFYLPRRLVRLAVPALASLVLAAGWWVLGHDTFDGSSTWVNQHATVDLPHAVLDSIGFLDGTSMLNSPLWSLRWELIFAVVFPALAVVVMATRRIWPLVLVGCVVSLRWSVSPGATDFPAEAARYLPLFVIGMVLADQAPSWRPRAERIPTAVWWLLGATAAFAIGARHLQGDALERIQSWHLGSVNLWALVGSAVLVAVVMFAPKLQARGTHPVLVWLAGRSFALYLVHDPIVVACSLLLRSADPVLVGLLALPLSLVLAEGFHRTIEKPAHLLAKRIG